MIGVDENTKDVVEKVKVPRTHAEKSTQEGLDAWAKEIEGKISKHLDKSTVKVEIFMPKKDTTLMFAGQAFFTDPDEGYQACKAVR